MKTLRQLLKRKLVEMEADRYFLFTAGHFLSFWPYNVFFSKMADSMAAETGSRYYTAHWPTSEAFGW